MSARVEAAANAYRETITELRLSEGGGFKVASQHRRSLDAALTAADQVTFSEAAIERAAIEIFALNYDPATWSWKSHENDRQSCRNLARAVVAALREGA